MKVLIDILTPKQCLFFGRLKEYLEERGDEVLLTAREHREVLGLLKLMGMEATVVGRYGGGTLRGKLEASAERILGLIPIVEGWKPDAIVSFTSPDAARVAFGLGIPHICVNDSPHAEGVLRLVLSISNLLFTPKIIPKSLYTRFGIEAHRIIQYNALDPMAWLKDFKPNPSVLNSLGLDGEKPIVTIRPEESYASYLLGKVGDRTQAHRLIEKLLESRIDAQLIVIPRYEEHLESLKRDYGDRIFLCTSVVDGASLLYYSSIFLGAGGTMTAEAALLGTPTVSCYPGEPYIVERYLVRQGLVKRAKGLEEAVAYVKLVLRRPEDFKERHRERARRLLQTMEDPVEVIAESLRKFLG
jgi:predicted glycosyltransferase